MANLRVRAIKFVQNGRVFYTVVLPAREWISRGIVDVWSDTQKPEETGYQRKPSATRLREVASYLQSPDAILPLGGLVNVRAPAGSVYGQLLQFEPDSSGSNSGKITSGWLTIPDEVLPLYVVDMQHRLGGLQWAIDEDGHEELGDFPVVATLADGLSKLEEIQQFELINTTQKKVRTDLARRLMAVQSATTEGRLAIEKRGRMWEARGAQVADWLGREGEIWRNRILPPNKSKREMPQAVVPETSFVTSLRPILLAPLFQHMDEEAVARIVDRYWQALAKTFPEAFAHPAEHVIQKTPGVFSLNALAPEVIELVRSEYGDKLTVENLRKTIEPWAYRGSEFWSVGEPEGAARYGSMKGFSLLAAELRDDLPRLDVDM